MRGFGTIQNEKQDLEKEANKNSCQRRIGSLTIHIVRNGKTHYDCDPEGFPSRLRYIRQVQRIRFDFGVLTLVPDRHQLGVRRVLGVPRDRLGGIMEALGVHLPVGNAEVPEELDAGRLLGSQPVAFLLVLVGSVLHHVPCLGPFLVGGLGNRRLGDSRCHGVVLGFFFFFFGVELLLLGVGDFLNVGLGFGAHCCCKNRW